MSGKGVHHPKDRRCSTTSFHRTLIAANMVLPVINEKQSTGASTLVLASGAAHAESRSSIMHAQQGTAKVMMLLESDG